MGKLQPSKYLTLRSTLKALGFERAAIKSYNDLANTATELKDEQNLEDTLAKLEIR